MQISKTTLTVLAGLVVGLLAKFGFQVSTETIVGIMVIVIALVGKFAQDANPSDNATPQAFVGNFIGSFGASSLILILPLILIEVGDFVIKKDGATKGWKTAAGNLIKAFGPVVTEIINGNESGFKKALRAVRDTIDGYLNPSGILGS